MLRDEIFRIWAPRESIWSPWVKPVLFSHIDVQASSEPLVTVDLSWAEPANGATAMVLDLPGPSGIAMGIELAKCGYRPIPLYNACPEEPEKPTVIAVRPILLALISSATPLENIPLPADAPPIFLLDAHRNIQLRSPEPGVMDNRSISLPTDFPSAELLLSRGIRRVVLVQDNTRMPQADLSHTLRRWQDAGIEIQAKDLTVLGEPRALAVPRPSGFRVLFYNLLATFGLKASPLGGFGGVLPFPSGG